MFALSLRNFVREHHSELVNPNLATIFNDIQQILS